MGWEIFPRHARHGRDRTKQNHAGVGTITPSFGPVLSHCHPFFAGWLCLRNTRELDNLAWLFSFQLCASHMAFSRVASRELLASLSRIALIHLLKLNSSPISHTHPLQINPHTYRENDWRKYNQIWHEIKANTS